MTTQWDSWKEWDKLSEGEQTWLRKQYEPRENALKAERNSLILKADDREKLLADFLRGILSGPCTPQVRTWCHGELVTLMLEKLGR